MDQDDLLEEAGFMWHARRRLWINTDRHIAFSDEVVADHSSTWLETKLAERVSGDRFVFHVNGPVPVPAALWEILEELGFFHLQPDVCVATTDSAR